MISAKSRCRRAGRVVDDDVDAPELFDRAAYDRVRHAVRGEVARDGQRAAAECRRDRTGAGGVADVDGDGRTALVEADGGGAAQAARGAGDDRDASGEVLGRDISGHGVMRRHTACSGVWALACSGVRLAGIEGQRRRGDEIFELAGVVALAIAAVMPAGGSATRWRRWRG